MCLWLSLFTALLILSSSVVISDFFVICCLCYCLLEYCYELHETYKHQFSASCKNLADIFSVLFFCYRSLMFHSNYPFFAIKDVSIWNGLKNDCQCLSCFLHFVIISAANIYWLQAYDDVVVVAAAVILWNSMLFSCCCYYSCCCHFNYHFNCCCCDMKLLVFIFQCWFFHVYFSYFYCFSVYISCVYCFSVYIPYVLCVYCVSVYILCDYCVSVYISCVHCFSVNISFVNCFSVYILCVYCFSEIYKEQHKVFY